MIVGTAGHIDHGKTSLVRALTGVDTDRLAAEKARGITIELGFAYLPRPDGSILGFVDVPGHERLVHTMLAGAAGIDLAMLVVAADDGVMPQTREHMAIIELLGIPRGLVALTKCDLVTPARQDEAKAEIAALLASTHLAGADIVPVSAVTKDGLDRLLSRLDAAAQGSARPRAAHRFRLAVDRCFALAGAGTVVTGTVVSGRVCVGDTVAVSPSGLEARVRSIHAQGRTAETGQAGERCALALVGPRIATDTVRRGDVVLDPGLHAPVVRIDAELRLLPDVRKPVGRWAPVKFHHAAAERDGRVMALNDAGIVPGATDYVQLLLDAPVAVAAGDRFVLRDAAGRQTIGGGTILDLAPPERRRGTPARRRALDARKISDADAALTALVACDEMVVDVTAFARERALDTAFAETAHDRLGLVALRAGNAISAVASQTWSVIVARIVEHLEAEHRRAPDRLGVDVERVRRAALARLPATVVPALVERLVAEQHAVREGALLRRPAHRLRISPEEARAWAMIAPQLGGAERFRPPRVRDLANDLDLDEPLVRKVLVAASRRGAVQEIANDHFFLAETVVEIADIVRALGAGDGNTFTAADLRDKLDNGRKVAIQILEFFDRHGLTMRRGDARRINKPKQALFSRQGP